MERGRKFVTRKPRLEQAGFSRAPEVLLPSTRSEVLEELDRVATSAACASSPRLGPAQLTSGESPRRLALKQGGRQWEVCRPKERGVIISCFPKPHCSHSGASLDETHEASVGPKWLVDRALMGGILRTFCTLRTGGRQRSRTLAAATGPGVRVGPGEGARSCDGSRERCLAGLHFPGSRCGKGYVLKETCRGGWCEAKRPRSPRSGLEGSAFKEVVRHEARGPDSACGKDTYRAGRAPARGAGSSRPSQCTEPNSRIGWVPRCLETGLHAMRVDLRLSNGCKLFGLLPLERRLSARRAT